MQVLNAHRQSGFTLFEAIIAMVITGIIASMVAVFIARPIEGYIDSVRRAGLTDVADLALKRMSLDIRAAVPNTVRVATGGQFIEFIPARSGGRYCSDTEVLGSCDQLGFGTTGDSFDVLSPDATVTSGDSIIVYNTNQTGLDAYAGSNRCVIASAAKASGALTLSAIPQAAATLALAGACSLPYNSPSRRFQLVASAGPVSYACENIGANGTLKRYTSYPLANRYQATQPTSGLGTGNLLASNVTACNFSYSTVSARNGILILAMTITREGEAVTLHHEIHVDNMP
jgi:MSHA biogenesis protein MshO